MIDSDEVLPGITFGEAKALARHVWPFKVAVDATLPPNEIHVRDADGKMVGKIVNIGLHDSTVSRAVPAPPTPRPWACPCCGGETVRDVTPDFPGARFCVAPRPNDPGYHIRWGGRNWNDVGALRTEEEQR